MKYDKKFTILLSLLLITLLLFVLLFFFAFGKQENILRAEYDLPDKTVDFRSATENFHVLKISHSMSVTHPQHKALSEKIGFEIQKDSTINIIPEIYPSNELGSSFNQWEALQKGTIEMLLINPSVLPGVHGLSLFSIPYLFEGYNDLESFMNQKSTKEYLIELFREKNIFYMGWSYNNFSHIVKTVSSQGGVRTVGLNHPNEYVEMYFSSAGFPAVEVYQPTVFKDIKKLPFSYVEISSEKIFQLEKNIDIEELELRNHILEPCFYLVNYDFWNSLTPMERSHLKSSVQHSIDYQKELIKRSEEVFQEYMDSVFKTDTRSYGFNIEVYQRWKKRHPDLNPDILE